MDHEFINTLKDILFRYYGVDWLVTIMVLLELFLLGNKKKAGFTAGIIASVFGLIFSWQVESLANGIASLVILFMNM